MREAQKEIKIVLEQVKIKQNQKVKIEWILSNWQNALNGRKYLAWKQFSKELIALGLEVDWNWVVAASDLVKTKYDDIPSLINTDGSDGWVQ